MLWVYDSTAIINILILTVLDFRRQNLSLQIRIMTSKVYPRAVKVNTG